MRLFNQLDEDERADVIDYCVHMVLHDVIDDEVEITADDDEGKALKEKFDAAIKHIETLPEIGDKMDYLMESEDISKAIFEFAIEMAKSAYYHDGDEIVIFPGELGADDEDEHDVDGDEDDLAEIPTDLQKPKKSNNLN